MGPLSSRYMAIEIIRSIGESISNPKNEKIISILIRDHGMDTQDLEFKFFAKRVESSYVVTATYV